MAGYSRQSAASIVPTAVVRATPLNDEFNALRDAFVVASGHKHDGTMSEGALVPLISDTNGRNKVVTDSANNRISLFVNVSGTAAEQLRVIDGAVIPVVDDDIDLGSSTFEFKNLFIDGTANIDSLVADTASISAGTINNVVIGGVTPNAVTGTVITANTGFVGGLTGNVTGNLTGNVIGNLTGTVTGTLVGNVSASSGTSTFNNVTISGTLNMDGATAATITNLSAPVNANDAATKGYVDTSISNLIGTAPGALDTLGEIADALNDDANLAATLTAQINGKVSKSGDTLTGSLAMSNNSITGLASPVASQDATNKSYVDTQRDSRLALSGGTMSGAIAMGTNKITGLGDPTLAQDAVTKIYVDTILGSTQSAAASASAAATSASNAAASASSASTSASNAAASASAAEASFDSFDDRYLGSKTANPTVDNDGNALLTGALYFNSVAGEMRVWNGSAWVAAYLPAAGYATLTGTETLTNKTIAFGSNTLTDVASLNTTQTFTGTKTFAGTSSSLALVLNDAAEVTTVSAIAATGTINYDITTQSVLYYTANASANWTVNFRASSGTSLNTALATGQSVTVAFLVTQGATAFFNNSIQVDGTASGVTVRWLGGAPTAGNVSGIDSYRYLIIKTGSATYTVLASVTQFKA